LERRKTPRSLPNRKPYFDQRDIDRIALHVELHFLKLAGHYSSFVPGGPPREVTHHCFFPYLKGAKHPEQERELMLFMRTVKDIDLDRAKRYLEYLGFDEVFVANYLEAYRTSNPEMRKEEKGLWSDEAFFYWWFTYLHSFTGEKLRSILAATASSEGKWEKRLVSCKATWENLRLSRGAMAAITARLFRRNFPANDIGYTSWIKKLQRWEVEQRSLRVVKDPEGQ
jgi:hypothetical protein